MVICPVCGNRMTFICHTSGAYESPLHWCSHCGTVDEAIHGYGVSHNWRMPHLAKFKRRAQVRKVKNES